MTRGWRGNYETVTKLTTYQNAKYDVVNGWG